jgi:anaerobic selenocysteine-containing dehydrogenase
LNDELLRKLEQRASRRTFLKGSALATAALVGIAAFPRLAGAQDQSKPNDQAGKKEDEKGDDKDSAGKSKQSDQKDPNAPTDPEFKVTKKDENGRDYRVCPQCGYNMYRQDRTWTCENCGFNYTE